MQLLFKCSFYSRAACMQRPQLCFKISRSVMQPCTTRAVKTQHYECQRHACCTCWLSSLHTRYSSSADLVHSTTSSYAIIIFWKEKHTHWEIFHTHMHTHARVRARARSQTHTWCTAQIYFGQRRHWCWSVSHRFWGCCQEVCIEAQRWHVC